MGAAYGRSNEPINRVYNFPTKDKSVLSSEKVMADIIPDLERFLALLNLENQI
jgi:hypothetical protein